ncbi:MAG TPA: electron transport complex subunit RsxC [Nitrospirae bacterium]|nr:electron transport complex subunit RsxC [Nitrospirota bacterium]
MALPTFKGGVHPPDHKELSAGAPVKEAPSPSQVLIPLSQHIGAPCKCTVKIGQEVKKGDLIGEPTGFVSAPVHSSVSGKVVALMDVPNAMGRMVPAVVIENNGKEEWAQLKDNPDYMRLAPEELREKVKDAGIVGMGGATFPTHVKLSPPKEKPVDVVIINGAECEPYLTADHRLMVESPAEVLEGLKVIMRILGVEKGYVGIESNKPDAVEKMKEAASGEAGIEVVELEVKYPQGAEKMLIKAITDREVPAGGLPMDVGVVVQNVGTALAIFEACRYGKPLIERVVTVTGRGVKNPGNLMAKIGTPVRELIEACGGLNDNPVKVVLGGPMMGFAQYTLDVPVAKGTSGVLVMSEEEHSASGKFGHCIRCGNCIDACPMGLMPSLLSIFSEKGFYEETKDYNILDCFECGTCTYVCPAKRPIVQFIRLAKSLIKR